MLATAVDKLFDGFINDNYYEHEQQRQYPKSIESNFTGPQFSIQMLKSDSRSTAATDLGTGNISYGYDGSGIQSMFVEIDGTSTNEFATTKISEKNTFADLVTVDNNLINQNPTFIVPSDHDYALSDNITNLNEIAYDLNNNPIKAIIDSLAHEFNKPLNNSTESNMESVGFNSKLNSLSSSMNNSDIGYESMSSPESQINYQQNPHQTQLNEQQSPLPNTSSINEDNSTGKDNLDFLLELMENNPSNGMDFINEPSNADDDILNLMDSDLMDLFSKFVH